jgi:WD40 repeat protein
LWSAVNGREIKRLQHSDKINALVFHPDETRLATASDDGTVRLWRPSDGSQLASLRHEGAVRDFGFSPDGTRLIAHSDSGTWYLWRTDIRPLVDLACRILNGHSPTGEEGSTSTETASVLDTGCQDAATISEY